MPPKVQTEKFLSEMPDQGAKIRWEYVFLLNTVGMAISNGKMSFQSFWILLPPSTPWLMLILGSMVNTHVASWSSSSSVCKRYAAAFNHCFLTFFPLFQWKIWRIWSYVFSPGWNLPKDVPFYTYANASYVYTWFNIIFTATDLLVKLVLELFLWSPFSERQI